MRIREFDRKYWMLAIVFFMASNVFSQKKESTEFKNSLKINVTALAGQLYSAQYERKIKKNLALNITGFFRQKSLIPFGVMVDTLAKRYGLGITGIKFQHIFMNEAKVGTFGISPEIRKYFGSKKHRWYTSAYGQFQQYDVNVPAAFAIKYGSLYVDAKAPADFQFTSLGAGVLFGKSFDFNRLGLDITLLGAHFGNADKFKASVSNELIGKLNTEDKNYIKSKIEERFGLNPTYFDIKIEGSEANIANIKKIPYLGLRGIGFNLRFNF
jgi:hypothetical protein